MADELNLASSTLKNAVKLVIVSIICMIAIGFTNKLARPEIELNAQKALQDSLVEIIPSATHTNNMLLNSITLAPDPLLGTNLSQTAYLAKNKAETVAVALPVTAPDGYGGAIHLLIGIYADGRISGVRVIPPHAETPGLGDKIDVKKSNWILTFAEKSLRLLKEKDWAVTKNGGVFDSFAGATITPRAVVNAVHNALLYFEQHKQMLLN